MVKATMTLSCDSVNTVYKEISSPQTQDDLQGHSYLPYTHSFVIISRKQSILTYPEYLQNNTVQSIAVLDAFEGQPS